MSQGGRETKSKKNSFGENEMKQRAREKEKERRYDLMKKEAMELIFKGKYCKTNHEIEYIERLYERWQKSSEVKLEIEEEGMMENIGCRKRNYWMQHYDE